VCAGPRAASVYMLARRTNSAASVYIYIACVAYACMFFPRFVDDPGRDPPGAVTICCYISAQVASLRLDTGLLAYKRG
jgi:hypothetical protein